MTDESGLRGKALEALQAGKVTNDRHADVWAGQGCGGYCTICSELLKPDELEYELEFASNSDGRSSQVYHMHIRCFAAWERERANFRMDCGGIASNDLPSSGSATTMVEREPKPHRAEEVP